MLLEGLVEVVVAMGHLARQRTVLQTQAVVAVESRLLA
jgi:hypothetical protein